MEQTEMAMVGLLEILAFRSGCTYLSDLHQPEFLPAIQRALYRISPGAVQLEGMAGCSSLYYGRTAFL